MLALTILIDQPASPPLGVDTQASVGDKPREALVVASAYMGGSFASNAMTKLEVKSSDSANDRLIGFTCHHGIRATMGYMCGRFAVTTDPALLAEKIQAIDETVASVKEDTSAANYNVAPTTTISSVVKRHSEPDDESTRRVRSMRWGLIPPWAKTAEDGGP